MLLGIFVWLLCGPLHLDLVFVCAVSFEWTWFLVNVDQFGTISVSRENDSTMSVSCQAKIMVMRCFQKSCRESIKWFRENKDGPVFPLHSSGCVKSSSPDYRSYQNGFELH